MTLVLVTELLLISLYFGIGEVAGNDSLDKRSEEFGLYPLMKSYQAGQEAQFLLVLPKSDENNTEWSVYFMKADTPFESGRLDTTSILRKIKVPIVDEGSYSVILIIRNQAGEPANIMMEEIKVIPGPISRWFSSISGIVVGVAIAVIVFLVQNYVQRRKEVERQRNELCAKISFAFARLRQWNGRTIQMPSLPSWMIDPTAAEWSIQIQKKPFKSIVCDLEEAHLQAAAGRLSEKDFREKLQELEHRLP